MASLWERSLPWLNWGIATSFVLFQFILQTAAGVMAVQWMHDFHLNELGVSNLSASYFYAYVILQIPVGIAYDRFGPRRILAVAAFMLAVGCMLLAYTHNYYMALLARVLMGAGSSFGFVGMLFVSANWFSAKRFSMLVSISETFAMLGVACGTVGIAALIMWVGWRESMWMSGVLALVVMVIVFWIVRDKPASATVAAEFTEEKPSLKDTFMLAMRQRQVWLAGIFGFAMFAMVNAFTSLWGIPFLLNTYHLNLHVAASIVSMVFIGIAVGGPFNVWLAPRIKRRKPILLIWCAISAALITSVLVIPKLPNIALYVLLFLVGFFSSVYVQCFAVIRESVTANILGASMALGNMLLMLSAPVLQSLIGGLLEAGVSYRLSLGVIPFAMVIAFVTACFIRETHCQ